MYYIVYLDYNIYYCCLQVPSIKVWEMMSAPSVLKYLNHFPYTRPIRRSK